MIFANSWLSTSNFKSFSQSLKQFFLTVCQNNFGNKIPIFNSAEAGAKTEADECGQLYDAVYENDFELVKQILCWDDKRLFHV